MSSGNRSPLCKGSGYLHHIFLLISLMIKDYLFIYLFFYVWEFCVHVCNCTCVSEEGMVSPYSPGCLRTLSLPASASWVMSTMSGLSLDFLIGYMHLLKSKLPSLCMWTRAVAPWDSSAGSWSAWRAACLTLGPWYGCCSETFHFEKRVWQTGLASPCIVQKSLCWWWLKTLACFLRCARISKWSCLLQWSTIHHACWPRNTSVKGKLNRGKQKKKYIDFFGLWSSEH